MKKVNFGFLRSKITRYYNTMKKAKHVLDDTPNYSKVISMLEDKFSFLSSKYGFVAKVVRKHSGIYFSEKNEKLEICFSYGFPEFEISMSMAFKRTGPFVFYTWGELLMSGLFDWDWDWVKNSHDKDLVALDTFYVFIMKNIDFIMNNSGFISDKLKDGRANMKWN